MNKVVFITGGSSGIGFETAKALASQGHTVYAAARRIERMEELRQSGINVISLDVTDEKSIDGCVERIIGEQGRIDVLINNAGYGYLGAIETVSMEEARRQLEVNIFGLARLTQLVLPHMRRQKSGRIINISSIAGKVPFSYGGWYNVSKFSVEALSDTLRIETKQFGIDVVIIEPSTIRTDWGLIAADNLEHSSAGTVYAASAEKEARLMRNLYHSSLLSGPDSVCRSICKAVNASKPRLRYKPGRGAGMIIFLHSILPNRLWDAINRLIY